MYFLKEGSTGFVLPKHKNTKYIDINQGNYFGVIDIVGCILQNQDNFNDEQLFKSNERFTR